MEGIAHSLRAINKLFLVTLIWTKMDIFQIFTNIMRSVVPKTEPPTTNNHPFKLNNRANKSISEEKSSLFQQIR
jgi:hypothetical protein